MTIDTSYLKELINAGYASYAETQARSMLTHEELKRSGIEDALRTAYNISPDFELFEGANSKSTDEKFLIIKAWGHGFFSEVNHLASNLLLAELTQRTPICLWGSNCMFRHQDELNSVGNFFKDLQNQIPAEIYECDDIYPGKWNKNNIHLENNQKHSGPESKITLQMLMNRSEKVVVSDFYSPVSSLIPWISEKSAYYGLSYEAIYDALYRKYLSPTHEITEFVENFSSQYLSGSNWVAVHMRGTDKVFESPELAKVNDQYHQFIAQIIKLNPAIKILLLTDSDVILRDMQGLYKDRVLATNFERGSGNLGVHYVTNDSVRAGKEVLIDALLATKADYFIGNIESNVSLAIKSFGSWNDGYIFMLGTKNGRGPNDFILKP